MEHMVIVLWQVARTAMACRPVLICRVVGGKPGHRGKPDHLSLLAYCATESEMNGKLYLFIVCVNNRLARYRSGRAILGDLVKFVDIDIGWLLINVSF